jgi:hypothetical protein
VPLSELSIAILKAQATRANRDFVFGDGPRSQGQDGGGFQGRSKAKAALNEQIQTNHRQRLQ